MKSLLLLSALLPLALTSTTQLLDPSQPIYLGEVFWPPTMTFIAWLPSEDGGLLEWCYRATDASNHMLFSLGGVDALQIHDYFDAAAYITREGKKFAECKITPESMRMGACEGVIDYDCEGGHKFTGPGTRRWSCWVLDELKANLTKEIEVEAKDGLTEGLYTQTNMQTGVMPMAATSSMMGMYTAGATGR
jgi:hypothetical protein